MTRLCAYTPPEGILDSIAQYLTTDEHIDLPVDRMQVVTNGDTTNRDKDKILVSLGIDFQQAATPVSVYARIMVRVEEPQSGTLTGLLPDPVYLSFRLAYHIKRYSLKSNTLISCDIDAAPTLMVEGLRQYAYMVLLCTVPMTGVAGGGGADTPNEQFKDEYSGDSAKLVLNEDCDPELGGMWRINPSVGNKQYIELGTTTILSHDLAAFNRFNRSTTSAPRDNYFFKATVGALVDGAYNIEFGIIQDSTPLQGKAGLLKETYIGASKSNTHLSGLAAGDTTNVTAVVELGWTKDRYIARPYISTDKPIEILHFQVTDITEHPELAPANAAKLLAKSTRQMKVMKELEAALAAQRIEGKGA